MVYSTKQKKFYIDSTMYYNVIYYSIHTIQTLYYKVLHLEYHRIVPGYELFIYLLFYWFLFGKSIVKKSSKLEKF